MSEQVDRDELVKALRDASGAYAILHVHQQYVIADKAIELCTSREPASGAVPIDREELANVLALEYDRHTGPDGEFLAIADKAIELCAGRMPAEVWGLVAKWRERVGDTDTPPLARSRWAAVADELEAALKSVPRPAEPAPRALPTREQLVALLRQPFDRQNLYDAAMRMEALLREHAAPASASGEVEALRAERDGFLAQVGYDSLAEVELDFLEWTQMQRERDEARAELAAEKAFRDREVLQEAEYIGKWREMHAKAERERDEARTLLQAEKEGGQRAFNDVSARLKATEESLAASCESYRLASNECDEARRLCDEAVTDRENAWVEADALKAQLAARPEPVVIDDTLIRSLELAYVDHIGTEEPMLHTMRSVFGERVSVAGLAADLTERHRTVLAERDLFRAELQAARESVTTLQGMLDDAEQVRAELQAAQKALELALNERDAAHDKIESNAAREVRLRTEIVDANSELRVEIDRERANRAREAKCLREARLALAELRGQHEALRVASKSVLECYGFHDAAAIACVDRLRALLNPATPEAQGWQHISSDGDSHTFRHASGVARTLEGFGTWEEAAAMLEEPRSVSATVTPGHQYATRADVERVEAALRTFLTDWHRGSFNKARAGEVLAKLDAGKQEVGK